MGDDDDDGEAERDLLEDEAEISAHAWDRLFLSDSSLHLSV